MAISLACYRDSSLTDLIDSGAPLTFNIEVGSHADASFYLGSPTDGNKFQATSDPGVDQIALSVYDSAGGSGEAATAIKLALSSANLDTATAGADLNLGTELLSGVAHAVQIWIRVTPTVTTAGSYTDVYPRTNVLDEMAV